MKNSRRNVPIAMTAAVTANSIIQWITMVVVCYRLGDPKVISRRKARSQLLSILTFRGKDQFTALRQSIH